MRARHAQEIRAGINAARESAARGIPPRPELPPGWEGIPPTLEERARRRTEDRFRPRKKPAKKKHLPPVPGIHTPQPRSRR